MARQALCWAVELGVHKSTEPLSAATAWGLSGLLQGLKKSPFQQELDDLQGVTWLEVFVRTHRTPPLGITSSSVNK